MNTIERLQVQVKREFPHARVVLDAPDDDNGTWQMMVLTADDAVHIQWHAGIDLVGLTRARSDRSVPDVLLHVHAVMETLRELCEPAPGTTSRERLAHDVGSVLEVSAASPDLSMLHLHGVAVTAGKAIGPAWIVPPLPTAGEPSPRDHVPHEAIRGELLRLETAFASAGDQVPRPTYGRDGEQREGPNESLQALFVQRALLSSEAVVAACRRRVREDEVSAESAVRRVVEGGGPLLDREDEPSPDWQADDLERAGDRLLQALVDTEIHAFDAPSLSRAIVVAVSLTESDLQHCSGAGVAGVLTEQRATDLVRGGSFGMPTVTGVAGVTGLVRSGALVALDGATGDIIVNPDAAALRLFRDGHRPAGP